MADVMDEPLAPDAAKKLIREILRAGRFIYSRHAKEELLADDLTTVVAAFRSRHEPVIVTAWRIGR